MQVMLYCDVSASEVLLPVCYPPHLPRSDSCILKSQQYSVLASCWQVCPNSSAVAKLCICFLGLPQHLATYRPRLSHC